VIGFQSAGTQLPRLLTAASPHMPPTRQPARKVAIWEARTSNQDSGSKLTFPLYTALPAQTGSTASWLSIPQRTRHPKKGARFRVNLDKVKSMYAVAAIMQVVKNIRKV